MGLAGMERAALCDLFDEVGPDAPTLCAGWTTRDLAAHLVLREGRPDASTGIVIKPLAGWTERVQRGLAEEDWSRLVGRIRGGPPLLSFYRLPGADEALNAMEYLVHHEDVRRARPGWQPRELPARAQDGAWKRLVGGGRALFRNTASGVTLRRREGNQAVVRAAEPMVVVVGDPVELVMFAYGRGAHADVELEGEAEAVAALRSARLGI